MKKVLYPNPETTETKTTLSQTVAVGDNSIVVANGTGFSVGDFILIEELGHELNEITRILSINGNIFSTLEMQYPHEKIGVNIIKVSYNQYRIKRSIDNITYQTIATNDLEYSQEQNKIEYNDNDGSDELYYQIYYYNSLTDTEDLQATLHKEKNFSYISADDFRAETGLTTEYVADNLIYDALRSGVEWIQDKTVVTKAVQSSSQDTLFELNDVYPPYVADLNADGVVDKNDIIIYEYDNNRKMRTYRHNNIVKLLPNNPPRLLLNKVLPTQGNTLIVEVPCTYREIQDVKSTLRTVNKLIAVNYVLINKPIETLKDVVTSWTSGGESINKDPSSVQSFIDSNIQQAQSLTDNILTKFYVQKSKLRTTRSSLNTQYGKWGVSTQGGNRY